MPISVVCPSCSGRFKAPDQAAGEDTICPTCEGPITIPASSNGAAPSSSFSPGESAGLPDSDDEGESRERAAIVFACQGCGANYKVPDSAAGQMVSCPRCAHPIKVPSRPQPPSEPEAFRAIPSEFKGPLSNSAPCAAMEFSCPGCGKQFQLLSVAVGMLVECPDCTKQFQVPSASDEEAPPPPPPPPPPPSVRPPTDGSLVVTCAACSGRFKVPGAAAGRTIKCPKCSRPIAVPGSASASAAAPVESSNGEDHHEESPPDPPKSHVEEEKEPDTWMAGMTPSEKKAPAQAAPMLIGCPACGMKLKAPPALVGKTVKCPKCAAPIKVGVAPAKPNPAPVPKPTAKDELVSPTRKQGESDPDDDVPAARGAALKAPSKLAAKKPAPPPSPEEPEEEELIDREEADSEPPEEEDVDEQPRKRKSRLDEDESPLRKKKRPDKGASPSAMLWVWVGLGIGVSLLLIGGVLAFTVFRGGETKPKTNLEVAANPPTSDQLTNLPMPKPKVTTPASVPAVPDTQPLLVPATQPLLVPPTQPLVVPDTQPKIVPDTQSKMIPDTKPMPDTKPIPTMPAKDPLAAALEGLKDADKAKKRAALDDLAKLEPIKAKQAAVAKMLEPLILDSDVFVRTAAVKAMGVWQTNDQVAFYLRGLADPKNQNKKDLFELLGKLPSESSASKIAPYLSVAAERPNASNALQNMGAVAERPVLQYLQHQDPQVRLEAIKVLGKVGTKRQSLPTLQNMKATAQQMVARKQQGADQLLSAITDAMTAITNRP